MRKYKVVQEKDYTDFSSKGLVFPMLLENDTHDSKMLSKTLMSTSVLFVSLPLKIFAASADATFGNVHSAIMGAFDVGVVMVIIFAGAAWALGHRGKALEILIGVCCGYILARHAVDVRDFLKSI
ncbi:glycosyltransferase [Paenisporosarcina sp. NPDC076907]|uniref:glycosyltransferase n=1 Tax=Paenisporosarcina sp. NPDC076907 TaxID=3390604 RepID=UPI003D03496C